jgi:tetratricopeptide (TPR) repeat protein
MKYWASRVFCVVSACAALAGVAGVARAQDNAALLRQASVFVEAERYKDAVAVLKTLEPENRQEEVSIGILTGKIYLAIDRSAKAIGYFEEALAQAPERFDAALGAAQTHLQLGQFKQARRFVQSAQALRPDSPEPNFVLAAIAFRTGNPTQANAQMLGLLKQRPDSEGVVIAYSSASCTCGVSN